MTPIVPEKSETGLARIIDRLAPTERIISALAGALEADIVNRDGSRGPDHKSRTTAALALLAYREGRPVERSETISVSLDADNAHGVEERLKNSPALRSAFRKMLEQAESGENKPVDV